ncbi:MAG: MATE family efflux transporter [Lachnospiraceae bacterium]
MKRTTSLNLTSGPILKTLSELALPIMASSMLATAYNITDMAWIGMLGAKAVAGVGVGGMYVWLSQGLASLPRMGGQVHAAQACGRGDYEKARSYASSAIQLSLFFGLLFSAACVLFIDPLLGFFQLDDANTYAAARSYMLITCGLLVFSYLNLTLTGLSTAQGDSKTPLMANLLGLISNMILDPMLILGIGPFPRLETVGAAIATVTAQILVFLVLLIKSLRAEEPNILRSIRLFTRFPANYYKDIFRIGFPTAIQGTLYCFISMVLTRMVSSFGAAAIATQRVGGQIESLSWNTADGFGSALNAFTAQNYGAGNSYRIRKGYRISFIIIALWGLLVTAAFVFFPTPISRLFFHEADAIATAVDYLIIIGFSEAFMSVELLTIGALSGLGRTRLCSIISIVLTGARIPLAMLLSGTALGLNGIWWALTLTSITKGIVFTLTFHHICKHLPGKRVRTI